MTDLRSPIIVEIAVKIFQVKIWRAGSRLQPSIGNKAQQSTDDITDVTESLNGFATDFCPASLPKHDKILTIFKFAF